MKTKIDDFINYINLEKKYSNHTIRAYKKDLYDFYNFINKHSISSFMNIKKKHIHEYLYFLSVKQLSNKTVSRKLACLKSLFDFLVKNDNIKNNVAKSVPSPKLDKKLPIFLNQDQISLLLNLSDFNDVIEIRNNLILEIFYSTGIRISELVRIEKKDIDMDKNSINIIIENAYNILHGLDCKKYSNSVKNNFLKKIFSICKL